MGLETKTKKAVDLFKDGKIKDSLRLFKTFKLGFTDNEKKTLQRAYEMYVRPEFYESIGYDKDIEIKAAKEIILKTYFN